MGGQLKDGLLLLLDAKYRVLIFYESFVETETVKKCVSNELLPIPHESVYISFQLLGHNCLYNNIMKI